MPADGGGIEEDVRARDARKARGFRIPLIPADQHAQTPEARVEIHEAEIARREIEFLEIQRIVGNMHLAIDAFDLAIGANHRRGVVIQTRAAPLEKRRDDHDAEFARQAPERLRGRSRNRLGQGKQLGVFFTAEILRAEQFLQADDLRARAAASRVRQRAFSRFSFGSSAQLICTRPTRNFSVLKDSISSIVSARAADAAINARLKSGYIYRVRRSRSARVR